MNGYCKMREKSSNFRSKSRSIDYSDLSFPSPPPPPPPSKSHESSGESGEVDAKAASKAQLGQTDIKSHDQFAWAEEGGGVVVLRRNSSSASQRFRESSERSCGGPGKLQAVVRRGFSMRKSSSVAEGYWRIHNTGDGDGEVLPEEEEEERHQKSSARRKRGGGVIKACKRLFGF